MTKIPEKSGGPLPSQIRLNPYADRLGLGTKDIKQWQQPDHKQFLGEVQELIHSMYESRDEAFSDQNVMEGVRLLEIYEDFKQKAEALARVISVLLLNVSTGSPSSAVADINRYIQKLKHLHYCAYQLEYLDACFTNPSSLIVQVNQAEHYRSRMDQGYIPEAMLAFSGTPSSCPAPVVTQIAQLYGLLRDPREYQDKESTLRLYGVTFKELAAKLAFIIHDLTCACFDGSVSVIPDTRLKHNGQLTAIRYCTFHFLGLARENLVGHHRHMTAHVQREIRDKPRTVGPVKHM